MTKPGPAVDYLSKGPRETPIGWAYSLLLALALLSFGCTIIIGSIAWGARRGEWAWLSLILGIIPVGFQFLIFSFPGLLYLTTHHIRREAEVLLGILIFAAPLISLLVIILALIIGILR